MERKVQLTEQCGENRPSAFNVSYIRGEKEDRITDHYRFFAAELDNHYLLKESIDFAQHINPPTEILGVSNSVKDAELRLHKKARSIAEWLAKTNEVRNLEDFSKYTPESLLKSKE